MRQDIGLNDVSGWFVKRVTEEEAAGVHHKLRRMRKSLLDMILRSFWKTQRSRIGSKGSNKKGKLNDKYSKLFWKQDRVWERTRQRE